MIELKRYVLALKDIIYITDMRPVNLRLILPVTLQSLIIAHHAILGIKVLKH